jgi:hypothetical protein
MVFLSCYAHNISILYVTWKKINWFIWIQWIKFSARINIDGQVSCFILNSELSIMNVYKFDLNRSVV